MGETLFDVSWKAMIADAMLPHEEADLRGDFMQLWKIRKGQQLP
jgi:hypothetical protein